MLQIDWSPVLTQLYSCWVSSGQDGTVHPPTSSRCERELAPSGSQTDGCFVQFKTTEVNRFFTTHPAADVWRLNGGQKRSFLTHIICIYLCSSTPRNFTPNKAWGRIDTRSCFKVGICQADQSHKDFKGYFWLCVDSIAHVASAFLPSLRQSLQTSAWILPQCVCEVALHNSSFSHIPHFAWRCLFSSRDGVTMATLHTITTHAWPLLEATTIFRQIMHVCGAVIFKLS